MQEEVSDTLSEQRKSQTTFSEDNIALKMAFNILESLQAMDVDKFYV